MCYPVCGMIHIKEPLLLIGKRFPLSLSEWSFTIILCLMPFLFVLLLLFFVFFYNMLGMTSLNL